MLSILKYLLLTLEVVTSLLLIGCILIQKTKSQGMGLAFGGGMGETLFGSQVGNVLTRVTVVLAIVFLVNTTVLALLGTQRVGGSVTDGIPVVAPSPVPSSMPVDTSGFGGDIPMDIPDTTVDGGGAVAVPDAPATPLLTVDGEGVEAVPAVADAPAATGGEGADTAGDATDQ